MSLEQLIAMCPPPAAPVNPPDATQWDALEKELGVALPDDYRSFLSTYGSGCFGSEETEGFFDLAFVVSPGQPADVHGQNAIPLMKDLTGSLARFRARWPRLVQSPVWPEPGGLLYVGGTTTRNDIYWKTEGKPAAWTCMVSDEYYDNWFEWAGDLTSLLAEIAKGDVPDWIIEGPTQFPLVFADLTSLVGRRLA